MTIPPPPDDRHADPAFDPAHPPAAVEARYPWRLWVVTLGGSGLFPLGPGTAGSLATALLLLASYFALTAGDRPYSHAGWNLILVSGILFFGALCVALGRWTATHFDRKDPGPCVLDEAAGICLTACFLPPIHTTGRAAVTLAVVFASFRVFDILKPPPAKQLEKLPHGWGILIDDLAAAVYANLAAQVVLRWVIP
jgi:phosphatidylglycerophosphatase A